MTINGVTIGDKFKRGRNMQSEVTDIREVRSVVTGEFIEYQCIARGIGLSTNEFPVSRTTIIRGLYQ